MNPAAAPARQQWLRFLRHRRRLLVAIAAGCLAGAVAAQVQVPVIAVLLGWNAFALVYLVLVALLAVQADARQVRGVATALDDFSVLVLSVVSLGAVISVAAIVVVLAGAQDPCDPVRTLKLWLAGSTVVLSWLLVPALYTLHYAHMYYAPREGEPPLAFVDDAGATADQGAAAHDYWDFAYFAFTIAVASQTADVATRGRSMRRTVLAQSLLAFVFNASVIGMSVNIAASLAFADRPLSPASACSAPAPPPPPPR